MTKPPSDLLRVASPSPRNTQQTPEPVESAVPDTPKPSLKALAARAFACSTARMTSPAPATDNPAHSAAVLRVLVASKFDPARDAAGRLRNVADAAGLDGVAILRAADADAIVGLTDTELLFYAHALASNAEREAGRQPAGWDHPSRCDACGPVWLWDGAPARVRACPWCANRRALKAIPRPPVRCGDCRHNQPDTINPDEGAGSCGAGHLPSQPYPHVMRRCGDWRPQDAPDED
jgi:hypothetical protein